MRKKRVREHRRNKKNREQTMRAKQVFHDEKPSKNQIKIDFRKI